MNYKLLVLTTLLSMLAFPCLAKDNQLTADEKAAGWQLLFNGKDMSQWRNFKKASISDKWQVKNGAMQLTAAGGGDLITHQAYQNFELTLEWKISQAGNSGIFILADERGKKIYSHAIEIQILDNEKHSDNKVPSHLSGSIYDLIASPTSSHLPAGHWNNVRILLNNKHLKVWQNNKLTADIVIDSPQWQTRVNKSKFATWQGFAKTTKGHIGLQDHDDPVAFKNIKIRELN